MIYLFENISYNHSLGTVNKAGEEFKLTKIQKKLLKFLLDNPQEVISKQVLMDKVWQRTVTENSIDQMIANLRCIVELDRTKPQIISTHFGQGFFLNCEVIIQQAVTNDKTSSGAALLPPKTILVAFSMFMTLLVVFLIYWTQVRVSPQIDPPSQHMSRADYMGQFTVDTRQSVDDMYAKLPLTVRKKFRKYLTNISDKQKQEVTFKLLDMTEVDRVQYILSL